VSGQAIIFAATVVSLYISSTIYHALPRSRIKRLFRLFDHSAVFLLIAGTYTLSALRALRGIWGWTFFGLVWSRAIFGIGFSSPGSIAVTLAIRDSGTLSRKHHQRPGELEGSWTKTLAPQGALD
jgi:hypothetical protein